MAEDRAGSWELKMERTDTHLCQVTGERTGHKSQKKQSLTAGTQPEASVLCSQQGTQEATKAHFISLPNLPLTLLLALQLQQQGLQPGLSVPAPPARTGGLLFLLY